MNDNGCIYVLQMETFPWMKVGYAVGEVPQCAQKRHAQLQVGCPLPLRLLRIYPCTNPGTIERWMHQLLAECHRRGEWFDTDLPTIDEVFATVMLHKDEPTFFMKTEQQERYVAYKEQWERYEGIPKGDGI